MNDSCARCEANKGITTPAVLHAYWGPALCSPCAMAVAALLDEHDKWPTVPWTETEQAALHLIPNNNEAAPPRAVHRQKGTAPE